MTIRRNAGFTLAEFVIAVVFVGIVLGPLLVFTARIHDLNSAMGQQGRTESWRSFCDQALAAGVDPSLAPALSGVVNAAVPAIPSSATERESVQSVAGLPRIIPIRMVLDRSVVESRTAGAGYEIGAGGAITARQSPSAPLAPIVMPTPVVTPPDGALLQPAAMRAGPPGQPSSTTIEAASAPGTRVFLGLNQPRSATQGLGAAQLTVTTVDLLNRVTGAAWTEYAGSESAGDRRITLDDGHTRWLVTNGEGRLQIYEPSPATGFGYQIELGAPVLVLGGDETAAGGAITFDYAAYGRVQNGTTSFRVDFPALVKAAFGVAWPQESIGFQCTFHDVAGPFSGQLGSFFLPDSAALWADALTVAATPVVPPGAASTAASWRLLRIATTLGAPRLTESPDGAGFFSPGQIRFTAPPGPDGSPIGRLSFNDGADVSTGPTLSVSVAP